MSDQDKSQIFPTEEVGDYKDVIRRIISGAQSARRIASCFPTGSDARATRRGIPRCQRSTQTMILEL